MDGSEGRAKRAASWKSTIQRIARRTRNASRGRRSAAAMRRRLGERLRRAEDRARSARPAERARTGRPGRSGRRCGSKPAPARRAAQAGRGPAHGRARRRRNDRRRRSAAPAGHARSGRGRAACRLAAHRRPSRSPTASLRPTRPACAQSRASPSPAHRARRPTHSPGNVATLATSRQISGGLQPSQCGKAVAPGASQQPNCKLERGVSGVCDDRRQGSGAPSATRPSSGGS